MITRFIIIVFLLIASFEVRGQGNWCDLHNRIEPSERKEAHERLNRQIKNHLQQFPIRSRSERYFQVVVHVVTKNPESVSYAEIVQQIDVLNKDFANRGENISKLNDEFVALAADTEIRFCLATVDPSGLPTTGVTYTSTDVDQIAIKRDNTTDRYVLYYDKLGGKSGWDHERYINIWIAEFGNGILGYGSLPGAAPYVEEIGLVMDPSFFGSFGQKPLHFDRGHTLTHEMGHFFGLLHIWGHDDDSCMDSDEVGDTPNAAGPYLACPSGVQVSCGESNMYQNFMDLTDDRCLAAFTHGQAARMHASTALFYPQLALSSPCHTGISSFDQWWNEIRWAYDFLSKEYVLYTPGNFSGTIQIEIYSADGKLIKSDIIENQRSYLIDLNGVPGIYFVRLRNGSSYHIRKIPVY